MAKKNIFEQHQSGGTATFLITSSEIIDLTTDLTDSSGDTQSVSITKLHWSGGATITDAGTGVSFTLSGNGAWSQFNGWTPVDVTGTLTIANTEASGTLFIEVKKGKGYN